MNAARTAVGVAALGVAAALRMAPHRDGLRALKTELSQQTGEPVLTAGMLGAWPTGTGAGGALLRALLEQKPAGRALVGHARNQRALKLYLRRGPIQSASDDMIIAWL